MNETLLLGLLFAMTFILGYVVGRLQKINVGSIEPSTKSGLFSRFSKKDLPVEKVSIDETKFVTTIKTDDYKKSFENFGNETTTKDDISSSVSKLSSLKKKK